MLLLLALLLVACQPAARPPTVRTLPAETPRAAPAPVRLPADDAPHNALTEWWYYTGHLWTAAGSRYGFELVIFQSIRGDNPVGYLSHFAITDPQRGKFRYAEQATTRRSPPTALDLDVQGWTIKGGAGHDRLAANMDDYAIELELRSEKPAVLHGGGYITFGPAGDSYYYSRTRLAVTGRLRDGDQWHDVTGQAWFDHQWGDFIVAAVGGWDWFSLQLADGSDVMLTTLHGPDGTRGPPFGTYVAPDGWTLDLTADRITLEPRATWTSPSTGGVYPVEWEVVLRPDAAAGVPPMTLYLTPLLPDQELALEPLPYWEGAVHITGLLDGAPVTGEGYVELTGYRPG